MLAKRVAVLIFVGWLVGIATGLLGLAFIGGWCEYRVVVVGAGNMTPGVVDSRNLAQVGELLKEGCEPIEVGDIPYLRCPRIRLGWP